MSTVRCVFAVLLLVGLPPGLLMWFIVHPFVGFWRRLGVRASLAINTVVMVAGVVGLWVLREPLLGHDLGTSWPLVVLGVALCVVAIRMGLARRKYLTFRILAGVPEFARAEDEQGTLLTEGPYARIRHPRYVELMTWTFAYAFIANYVGVYILALVTPPLVHLVVLMEEQELRDRFGEEYGLYSARVPRYIPRKVRHGAV
jgi:protein-S-isoprenylcysteine O-methyltransferase Ste14